MRVRHFSCKLSRAMVIVQRPCAFRLRKLAQNAVPGNGVRHFSYKLPRGKGFVKCLCAFRVRRLGQNGCRGKRARHVSSKLLMPRDMAVVKCPCVILCSLMCVPLYVLICGSYKFSCVRVRCVL